MNTREWAFTLRVLVPVLAGALLAGVGAWLTLGQDVIHRDDLQKAIETNSPYSRDKALIMQRLRDLTVLENRDNALITEFHDNLHKLETRVAVLTEEIKILRLRRARTTASHRKGAQTQISRSSTVNLQPVLVTLPKPTPKPQPPPAKPPPSPPAKPKPPPTVAVPQSAPAQTVGNPNAAAHANPHSAVARGKTPGPPAWAHSNTHRKK